jgi:hypothetical protein
VGLQLHYPPQFPAIQCAFQVIGFVGIEHLQCVEEPCVSAISFGVTAHAQIGRYSSPDLRPMENAPPIDVHGLTDVDHARNPVQHGVDSRLCGQLGHSIDGRHAENGVSP